MLGVQYRKPLPLFTIYLYLYLKFDVRHDYANANSVRPIVCCNRRHPDHVIAHKSSGDYVIIRAAFSLDYKAHTHTHTHTHTHNSAYGNLNFSRVEVEQPGAQYAGDSPLVMCGDYIG